MEPPTLEHASVIIESHYIAFFWLTLIMLVISLVVLFQHPRIFLFFGRNPMVGALGVSFILGAVLMANMLCFFGMGGFRLG